jgi:hypothetical protein
MPTPVELDDAEKAALAELLKRLWRGRFGLRFRVELGERFSNGL